MSCQASDTAQCGAQARDSVDRAAEHQRNLTPTEFEEIVGGCLLAEALPFTSFHGPYTHRWPYTPLTVHTTGRTHWPTTGRTIPSGADCARRVWSLPDTFLQGRRAQRDAQVTGEQRARDCLTREGNATAITVLRILGERRGGWIVEDREDGMSSEGRFGDAGGWFSDPCGSGQSTLNGLPFCTLGSLPPVTHSTGATRHAGIPS